MFNNNRKGRGTKEWAEQGRNIGSGCSNDCIYCYARFNACVRWRTKPPEKWTEESIVDSWLEKEQPKINGVIMFPTQHDITPHYLDASLYLIKRILDAGNNILIVSKPQMECIVNVVKVLLEYPPEQSMVRFSIGSLDPEIMKFWERGASTPRERIECLEHAHRHGINTSVSAEPLLPTSESYAETGRRLYDALLPHISNDIWFGRLNHPTQRIIDKDKYADEIKRLQNFQSMYACLEFYDTAKHLPKIKWKDSITNLVKKRQGLAESGGGNDK